MTIACMGGIAGLLAHPNHNAYLQLGFNRISALRYERAPRVTRGSQNVAELEFPLDARTIHNQYLVRYRDDIGSSRHSSPSPHG
nr:hypothetical protein CFP56_19511 [Quercus suber]